MSFMDANMKGPVFVLIRFPLARVQACKNALMKHGSIHRNYSGAVSGLSRRIQVIEGDWSRGKGVALLSFETYKEAQRWKDSVPEIRQPDWLDGVDLIIVPVNEMPPDDKRFVQLMEIEFKNMDEFIQDYSTNTMGYIAAAAGATGGVVSTSKMERVKGCWDPAYLILNFWSSPENFEAAYSSEDYQPLKEKRFLSANTNSVIFELEPISSRRG